jgi:urease accessory protein
MDMPPRNASAVLSENRLLPCAPNWQARLELEFGQRKGKSLLTRQRHVGPLLVQKTLHPEGDAVCHAVIVHPPGGIAGGDVLEMMVGIGEGAHVLLTTPGATKWYRSRGEPSHQSLEARIAENAALEWLPQENIVFDAARATLQASWRLHPGARMIGWEIVCLGRAASGERFRQGRLVQRMDLYLADRLVWRERGEIHGDSPLLQSPAGLRGQMVYGTLWLAGLPPDRILLETLRGLHFDHGDCAVTALPQVTVIRALSSSGEALREHFIRLWHMARPRYLQRAAHPPRIWAT